MNPLDFYKKLLTLTLILCGSTLFAQPANDNCSGAIEIAIAADMAACVPISGTTVGANPDDQGTNPTSVCSGSWFRDDVWYRFNTGDEVPGKSLVVDVEFSNIDNAGIAFYASCGVEEISLNCASDNPGGSLAIPTTFLEPNQDVWIRIWSSGHATNNAADFTMCLYASETSLFPEEEVLWGNNGEGSFTGGLNGWTIENVIDTCGWEHWANGLDPRGNYGDASLVSPTSVTGTVVFNSDYQDNRGGCTAPQGGSLVSPVIDLTGNEQDFLALSFYQTFRQFGSSTFVEYTFDDGATWAGRLINTDIATNTGLARGRFRFNIPYSASQGASSLQVRFRMDPANYYYWMIDDVEIVFGECTDLVGPANDYYAIAPNIQTPITQVQEIAFLADVANVGACDADNIELSMSIADGSGEIYSDVKNYGTITAGNDVQNDPFDNTYMMPAAVGTYTGLYSITDGLADSDSTDNFQSFEFEITEDIFAKERNVNPDVFNVNPALWDDTELKSWGVGNHYYVPNGFSPDGYPYVLSNLTIGYLGDATNAGQVYDIFLYTWEDDGDGLVQENERTIVASTAIEVNEADGFGNIDVVLEAEDGGDQVVLKSNTHYIAWVQYSDNDAVLEFNFGFDNELDYGAMDLAFDTLSAEAGDPSLNRYGTLWISDEDLTGEYRDFGTAAIIRMKVNEFITDVDDVLPASNKISVYPNPTTDQVNLKMRLVQNEENVKVNILDITGKILKSQDLENVQAHTETFDVSDLPSGAYMMQYISETGTRTLKFTKQ